MRKNTLNKGARKAAREAARLAKSEEKIAQKIFRQQVKEMRPFLKSLKKIDLRLKPTTAQKSRVTKAWKDYQALTTRPTKIYKPKDKKRLQLAQAYGHREKGRTKFDVAFIPVADPNAKLKFKKDRVEIRSKYVTETVLYFNMRNLTANSKAEIDRVLNKDKKAKQFVILAGDYLYNGGLARSLVEGRILELMARYSPGGSEYMTSGNNHYKNWLFGLMAYEANNQTDINEYRKTYNNKARSIKKEKGRARKRNLYKYGKKF